MFARCLYLIFSLNCSHVEAGALASQDLRFALLGSDQITAILLLRAGFHDAATYSHTTATGGADGSILKRNEGLAPALLMLETCRASHPQVTLADMLQVCSLSPVLTLSSIPSSYCIAIAWVHSRGSPHWRTRSAGVGRSLIRWHH